MAIQEINSPLLSEVPCKSASQSPKNDGSRKETFGLPYRQIHSFESVLVVQIHKVFSHYQSALFTRVKGNLKVFFRFLFCSTIINLKCTWKETDLTITSTLFQYSINRSNCYKTTKSSQQKMKERKQQKKNANFPVVLHKSQEQHKYGQKRRKKAVFLFQAFPFTIFHKLKGHQFSSRLRIFYSFWWSS